MESYIDNASGEMARNAQQQWVMSTVTLRPLLQFSGARAPDKAAIALLHHEAHVACFIAHSVKTEVRCEPLY